MVRPDAPRAAVHRCAARAPRPRLFTAALSGDTVPRRPGTAPDAMPMRGAACTSPPTPSEPAWLGENRAAMAGFLVGLLATFLFVRINTRLIRAKVSWWFHDIESEGGTHVHHMVIGVVLMVDRRHPAHRHWRPTGLLAQVLALLFGVGVALTLDEFALILHLQDVYWRKEGRLSVDAVIIVGLRGVAVRARPQSVRRPRRPGLSGDVAPRRRRRLRHRRHRAGRCSACSRARSGPGCSACSSRSLAIVGAIRLARPNSPWARRRYRSGRRSWPRRSAARRA